MQNSAAAGDAMVKCINGPMNLKIRLNLGSQANNFAKCPSTETQKVSVLFYYLFLYSLLNMLFSYYCFSLTHSLAAYCSSNQRSNLLGAPNK